MGSTNLVTRKITASGTTDADAAPIMKYGRIHRIDTNAAAGAELIIRDGPLAGDDILHRVWVPAAGLVPGGNAAWRLTKETHYYSVGANTFYVTFE